MHIVHSVNDIPLQTAASFLDHCQGFSRRTLLDHTITGCVHTSIGVCQLESGGWITSHLHSFEEAFYILEGEVLLNINGRHLCFGPGDFGFIPTAAEHSWHNVGDTAVLWHETLSPQPRPLDHAEPDTFFLPGNKLPRDGQPADLRDPRTRYLGHFDDSQLPPPSQIQMDGFRGDNIHGISLKMLVDHFLGAHHLTTFIVEFQPGGAGTVHDHPFEETYFFLSGEAEGILDGQTYRVKAGDFVWAGVGGTHGFFPLGDKPVRWLETQAPQPPSQHAFRFNANWRYLAEKLKSS